MGGLPALTPIRKILIANRGEIACRIARTARRLGIACAGVYSDADRESLHVRSVDEAVWIGAAPASESYLRIDKIIDAAKRLGADAIHPGYGFLAENAEFAEACAAASITFLGPRPETIRQMGSKATGRAIAASCGVPVVPGYQGDDLAAGAEALGYPLMIKASAGGGGRGMRLVEDPSQFAAAVESAEREARAGFGDGTLILERAIADAHHIEVQIFGDLHGQVIHLFERDCSMQRRHQKFIEESPTPAIADIVRGRLYEAAIAIGRAVGYVNAGTVEFLVAPRGEFYFIEMNTRIQVEHPVTEFVTGLDLIEMQIAVAEGRSLDEFPLVEAPMGHAIEVRVCAEDPLNEFAPSIGRLAFCELTGDRVDTGVEAGTLVTPHYDSMLAKLIVHRGTRAEAMARMLECLRGTRVLGVETNCGYLAQVLESDEFREGRSTISFLPAPVEADLARLELSARALASWIFESEIAGRRVLPGVRDYRNSPWRPASIRLRSRGRVIDAMVEARSLTVAVRNDCADGIARCVTGAVTNRGADGVARCVTGAVRNGGADGVARCVTRAVTNRGADGIESCVTGAVRNRGAAFVVEIDGITRTYEVASSGTAYLISSTLGQFHFERVVRHPKPKSAGSNAAASSPMPGKVLRVLVMPGAVVKVGDPLVVLEAMKMEQTIRCQMDGVVGAILVKVGDVVSPGQTLVQILGG
jgi:acetyl/propionyl-CoA carboxylase alpha subunit